MDIIFLTGAGNEPAQSIARRLVAAGFRVYGFAARFPEQGFTHTDFMPVPVNLTDPAAVEAAAAEILARETALVGVIHAAHFDIADPFEAIHPGDISLAVNAAVTAPLLLTRAALPTLVRQRGHVIAITRSNDAAPAASALSAALTGALRGFAESLFAELRDTGVKTAHIRLENNLGPRDPQARLARSPQSRVQPDIVADTVEFLLRLRENNALTELVLRPQATRENPHLPITSEPRLRIWEKVNVRLPSPEGTPTPEERIHTPTPARPEYAPPPELRDTSDDDPDDDNSVDPELQYLIKRQPDPRQSDLRQQSPRPPENTRDSGSNDVSDGHGNNAGYGGSAGDNNDSYGSGNGVNYGGSTGGNNYGSGNGGSSGNASSVSGRSANKANDGIAYPPSRTGRGGRPIRKPSVAIRIHPPQFGNPTRYDNDDNADDDNAVRADDNPVR
ncbi:MAG: SDR family NAD(P)-dependent oxidoreductase, partial [Puniceicoccales bacterium]|nr:SDR family NAD(P)-dependent oxidoreductase [Puniceicoccales bacterium]